MEVGLSIFFEATFSKCRRNWRCCNSNFGPKPGNVYVCVYMYACTYVCVCVCACRVTVYSEKTCDWVNAYQRVKKTDQQHMHTTRTHTYTHKCMHAHLTRPWTNEQADREEAERKRNMLVLVLDYLVRYRYIDSAERLQHESGVSLTKWMCADNIDLNSVVQVCMCMRAWVSVYVCIYMCSCVLKSNRCVCVCSCVLVCVCVCACMCVQEFEDFYQFKFGRKPKFVRRLKSEGVY